PDGKVADPARDELSRPRAARRIPLDRADRAAETVRLDDVDGPVRKHDRHCGRRDVARRPAVCRDPPSLHGAALANPRKHELAQPVALAPARVSDDRKPRSIEREARPAGRDSGVEPPREEALDPVVARQPDDVETADAGADDEGDRPGRPGREGGRARALRYPGRALRP